MTGRAAADCVFCRIVAGEIPCDTLCEDDLTLAFLDINPVSPGHALVIAKRHAPSLMDALDADLVPILPMARRVARAIAGVLEPDGINLVQANGPGAAQSVFHFHVHVVPRRKGDGLPMTWELRPGDRSAIASTAARLRAAIARDTAAGPAPPPSVPEGPWGP